MRTHDVPKNTVNASPTLCASQKRRRRTNNTGLLRNHALRPFSLGRHYVKGTIIFKFTATKMASVFDQKCSGLRKQIKKLHEQNVHLVNENQKLVDKVAELQYRSSVRPTTVLNEYENIVCSRCIKLEAEMDKEMELFHQQIDNITKENNKRQKENACLRLKSHKLTAATQEESKTALESAKESRGHRQSSLHADVESSKRRSKSLIDKVNALCLVADNSVAATKIDNQCSEAKTPSELTALQNLLDPEEVEALIKQVCYQLTRRLREKNSKLLELKLNYKLITRSHDSWKKQCSLLSNELGKISMENITLQYKITYFNNYPRMLEKSALTSPAFLIQNSSSDNTGSSPPMLPSKAYLTRLLLPKDDKV